MRRATLRAHGFRTSASSLLNESGYWNPDAIERALAHAVGGTITDYWPATAFGAYWAFDGASFDSSSRGEVRRDERSR